MKLKALSFGAYYGILKQTSIADRIISYLSNIWQCKKYKYPCHNTKVVGYSSMLRAALQYTLNVTLMLWMLLSRNELWLKK